MADSMAEMPRHNLELKARCTDLAGAAQRLQEFGARLADVERQADSYFHVPHGRLKLREIDGQSAVLIWYERADQPSFKSSHYRLVPVANADSLKAALTAALGIRGVVQKRREIWLYRNVRIHLDEVAGLGSFIEFEAVLAEGADLGASRTILDQLAALLAIQTGDCLATSYADLLGL
jgi:predicted adenylyl cyclase CyaB